MNKPREVKKPKTFPIDPDRELLTWEKWIIIRKEETSRLGKLVKRPPADLVMNICENIHEDKERKIVLEHAQIERKVGVRDTLWEQPQRLKQRCYCEPVYEFQRTSAEMGRPPVIEHIGVPTTIQTTELGLTGIPERIHCNILDTEYHNYRVKREKNLQEKIIQIDPFRPEIGSLMIKGNKPRTPPKKKPLLPKITIDMNSDTSEDLDNVYAIRINNTIVLKTIPGQNLSHLNKMKQEPWHENCVSWTYYFNVPAKKAGRGKLYLKNLGTVTLRYCWKKVKKLIPFIPEDVCEQVFFFNKNEDVLSPGQEKYIYFTFVSDKPGIYSEIWELSFCNICFFDTLGSKLGVYLYGDSVEDVEKRKNAVKQLESYLNGKSVLNIVRELINDVVDKAVVVKPLIYPYKKYFLEAELFVMKNPVCFYHQTEVSKMKELYAEMSKNDEWDLCIATWRQMMMSKDFDDRMKYYELLRKSHSDFLKPWYEGEGLLQSKYRAVNILLGQLADKFEVELTRIYDLYIPPVQDENYTSSFESRPSLAGSQQRVGSATNLEPAITTVRNIFYMQMYEHVATTIETCAGVLSSLDLNRWIDFDFCRN